MGWHVPTMALFSLGRKLPWMLGKGTRRGQVSHCYVAVELESKVLTLTFEIVPV